MMNNREGNQRSVIFRFNDRNYKPGEWEAWYKSEVLAHSVSLDRLQRAFPNGEVAR